jgi:hypothetical protein
VLSEFDDLENSSLGEGEAARSRGAPAPPPAAAEAPGHVSSTPEDESPSLGGHQSEDDGYMSMNGRRAKFVLSFRPVPDEGQALELPPAPEPPPDPPPTEMADFPPPPEEAERIISTLLPRYVVIPGDLSIRSHCPVYMNIPPLNIWAPNHKITIFSKSVQTILFEFY